MYTVIITTGAISISEIFKTNHTLQVLHISGNPIGDEGIEAIARTLNNAMISELYIWECSITGAGAKALVTGLIHNHTIKLLGVEENDITPDGAIAILEVAVANGVCQEVIIDEQYKGNSNVEKMMKVLEERKRQEVGNIIA